MSSNVKNEFCNLEWQNLNLTVKQRQFSYFKCRDKVEEKRILDNVSGSIQSGQLVAILGQSGAGKTTLLASVSQRFRGPLKGHILVNGIEIDRKTMTDISCFVPQFDTALNTLTPREHLYFMGELKLDRKWSGSRKNARIQFLLGELGLEHVANNRISTLSGGERKKLSLATDLLTNPPIIFCDEPTTGLDSFNARKVIESLKYLANTNNDTALSVENGHVENKNGIELSSKMVLEKHHSPAKAIICSIHQPTSEIFQCFSHLIVMYEGRCVFQGSSEEALAHFSKLGYPCPASYNPADFYCKVLFDKSHGGQQQETTFFQKPIDTLRQSFEYRQPETIEFNSSFDVSNYKIETPGWLKQVWLLMRRSYLSTSRSGGEILLDIGMYLIPFVAIAFLYHDTTGHTQQSIRDVEGGFFILACELLFTMAYGIIHFYPSQMPILRREANEHVYQFSAYYVAEVFNILPISFLRSFAGIPILYLWAGFDISAKLYLQLGFTLFVASFTGNAYGLFVSGLFRAVITEVATIFDLVFLSLSGYYMNLEAIPYARYISPFFFTNEGLSISFWTAITEIECPAQLNGQCLRNGVEVLQSYSYNTHAIDVLYDYLGLFALGLIMHILGYLGIRRQITTVGYY